jgi:DNA polymerase III gamma/tau subunit
MVVLVYQAVSAGDGVKALELFTDCYLEGRDVVSLFDQLLSLLRDLYVLKATGRQEYLMSSSSSDPRLLQELASSADGATLEYFVSCVSDLLTRLTRTAIKRTDGEMCLLKMCLRHQSLDAKQAALPAAAPAPARSAPTPKAAPAPVAEDGPPPFSDSDLPPWESEGYIPEPPAPVREQPKAPPAPAPVSRPAPAPTRTEAPVRTAAPASGGDNAVRDAFMAVAASRVSSPVRTYLNLADMNAADGTLYIACREESMIFMKKPAVQEVLEEAAKACGYAAVHIRKMGEPLPGAAARPAADISAPKPEAKPADPMADILARAKALGVEIK